MKNASFVQNLQVVSIREGQVSGKPQSLLVNPDTKKVEYLVLKDVNADGVAMLSMQNVVSIGEDFIVINALADIKKAYQSRVYFEALDRGFSLLGIRVLAVSGDIMGAVTDYEFDTKTGEIHSISSDDTTFTGEQITMITKNMIFVNTDGTPIELPKDDEGIDNESVSYLLGKTLTANVTDESGNIVAIEGTVITQEIIREAQKYDALVQLTMNAM